MKLNISVIIISSGHDPDLVELSIEYFKNLVNEIIIVDNRITVEQKRDGISMILHNNLKESIILAENQCKSDWIIHIRPGEILCQENIQDIDFIFNNNLQNKYQIYAFWISNKLFENKKSNYLKMQSLKAKLYNKTLFTYNSLPSLNSVMRKSRPDVYILNEPIFRYHKKTKYHFYIDKVLSWFSYSL